MYAQCPECLTFFHLKPAHLKAAQGRVRCSRCKHVFNALETLRDELAPEEIAAVEAAQRRESKADAPTLDEEYAGDLFDSLEYTQTGELGLDVDASASTAPAEPADTGAGLTRGIHDFGAPRPRRQRPLLLAAVNLVLVLALAAQLVHWQRFEILEHPLAGTYLARIYAALGVSIEPPRDLTALTVSRTEVSSHPAHPGALHLTAVIENAADRPQPWPELHVNLQNRWGETVAARYFTPVEYLRDPSNAETPFAAHALHAIELAIRDPGNNAVGFQIEPCFSDGARRLCHADIDTKK